VLTPGTRFNQPHDGRDVPTGQPGEIATAGPQWLAPLAVLMRIGVIATLTVTSAGRYRHQGVSRAFKIVDRKSDDPGRGFNVTNEIEDVASWRAEVPAAGVVADEKPAKP
jgi:hypothetical protein